MSRLSERDSEIYAQKLLPKGHGYPMWTPQPLLDLPDAYKAQGIAIGDVGRITASGAFDYLFNICQPANASVNEEGMIPDNFEQVELTPRDLADENFRPPGSDISSTSIKSTTFNANLSSETSP
jgi:hypothetical protein